MHSNWLAQFLVQQSEPLNQAFRLSQQGDPTQFANIFSGFVKDALDPLLVALDHWSPEHKIALTETAYHSGLTMARHGWLTPEHQAVSGALFRQLLPEWLSPYPDEAPRLLVQLLNGLSHIPTIKQRGQLLVHWRTCLPTPDATPDTLLVLCWISGLPQFREAALVAIQRNPELTETLALGDPKCFDHPWWQGPQLQWRHCPVELGASIWLSGEFTHRPLLVSTPTHTLIQVRKDYWQLHADAFGQRLLPHRQGHSRSLPVPECTQTPVHLAKWWREFDQPRQCLQRQYDWVISFHNRYAVLVIPKAGNRHE